MTEEKQTELVVNRREAWLFVATLVMLTVAVATLIPTLVILRSWARDAAETHAAACSFRESVHQQFTEAENFLATHPEGFAGIPAAQIQATADRQKATYNSLSGLHC